MKKEIYLSCLKAFLFISPILLHAQECEPVNPNSSLDIVQDVNIVANGVDAFFLGLIPSWRTSHGTPHLVEVDPLSSNCNFINIPRQDALRCIYATRFLQQQGGNSVEILSSEGIFSNVNIISDPTVSYKVDVNANVLPCGSPDDGGTIHVEFADGLVNNNNQVPGFFPNPTNQQSIATFDVNNTTPQVYSFDNIIPNQNYSQLWLHIETEVNTTALAQINSVELSCKTNALSGINKTKNAYDNFTFQADASKSFQSYTWTVNGIEAGQGATLTYQFNLERVYKVCLDVVDEFGCCAQECTLVAVSSVCDIAEDAIIIYDCYDDTFDGIVNLSDVIDLSGIGTNIIGENFYIAPYTELVLDAGFLTISSCSFLCDAGSLIRSSFGFLTVNGCRFEGCDQMWKGIYNDEATLDNFTGNWIYDAEYGINITNGIQITIHGNEFIDDYIGIKFFIQEGFNSPSNTIIGNLFTTGTGLKSAFVGQQKDRNFTYSGIRSSNLTLLNVGNGSEANQNIFDNIHNGIILNHGDMICNENNFKNLFINSSSPEDGRAIELSYTLGNVDILNSRFENCHKGVYAREIINGAYNISSNWFENFNIDVFGIAIQLRQSLMSSFDIINNDFIESSSGIALDNHNFCDILVDNNRMTNTGENISVRFSNPDLGKEFLITNNTITNYFDDLNKFGIKLQTSDRVQLTSNTIENLNPYYDGTGIRLYSSDFNIIEKNRLEAFFYGMALSGSTYNDIFCNLTDEGSRGIRFSNPCLSTDLKTNVLQESYFASIELSNATISDQNYKGNIFIGSGSKGRLTNGSPLINNQFIYNGNDPIPSPFDAAPYLPSDWKPQIIDLGGATGVWFDNKFDLNNAICVGGPRNLEGLPIAQLETIAQGQSYGNQYFDQNLWTSQWQLLSLIDEYPDLLYSEVINTFHQSNSEIKEYYNVAKTIDNIPILENLNLEILASHQAEINTRLLQIEQLISSINEENKESIVDEIELIQADIHVYKLLISTIKSNCDLAQKESAGVLKTELSNLPITHPFCSDFKQVWNARLDLILYDESYVQSNYVESLIDIAESCEYETGLPHYWAQALCDQLNLPYQEDECIEMRTSDGEIIVDQVILSPNPSSSLLNIESSIPVKSWILYATDGSIMNRSDKEENVQFSIDIGNLSLGMYFLGIIDKNNKILLKKFIKI